ncbi:MAG: methyltransferase domain-containing protein [Prochlorococcus marinus XMU1422]|nr:methyltransferase domain-containing protein [Prochlorococcus marinus XMU1421]MBO7013253.1 methyltransferase domain-containing protein [Prochlorococcus marinus XMU1422]MCR8542292.1 class I SAM-dependent methyltransferase [Prochlorococcus marinus XMU1423]
MSTYTKIQSINYTPYNPNDPIQKAIGDIYQNQLNLLKKTNPNEKKVLDYACGPGRYLDFFPRNLSVDFVDPSYYSIKILKDKIFSNKSEAFQKTICSKLDNIKTKYDMIFSFGLIGEHIPISKSLLNLFIDRLNFDSKLIISIDLLNPQSKFFLRSIRDIIDTNLRIYSIKIPYLSSKRTFAPEIIKYINNKRILSYDIYPLISPYSNTQKSIYRHCILEINV